MSKCKNIECVELTIGKRIYCSLSCRNIYVNKNLRNYSKISESLSKSAKDVYELNSKYCIKADCGNKIPYSKRRNNFCNSTCSASFNNLNREMSDEAKFKIKQHYIERGLKIECKFCNELFFKKTNSKYCSSNCRKLYRQKDMTKFGLYKQKCKFIFSLNDFPNEFNFELIEKYGWYKPKNRGDNLNGVSRDHMVSIRDGFNKNINPYYISHPANCELMVHNENISKNMKSSLSIEELIKKN